MPAVGVGNFRQLPAKPAPKPPPASTGTASNPRGVAIAPSPAPTVNDRQAVQQTIARAQAGTPRGTSIPSAPLPQTVNDVHAQHPDPASVIKVFNAQPPKLKQAVVQNAVKYPTLPASKILLNYVRQQTSGPAGELSPITAAVKAPTLSAVSSELAGLPKGVFKVAQNAAKDIVGLPAGALSTVAAGYQGINDIASGHIGKGLGEEYNAGIKPYVQLAEHPGQSLVNHPVDSLLMASGLLHGATRLAAAPVRAFAPEGSLAARAVSTERPSVTLTGNLTHERPPFSKSPSVKLGQVAFDKALYKRNGVGELVPRGEFARTRQINQGVGHLVGVEERIRRVNRGEAEAARTEAVAPSLVRRAGKAAKRTLAYGSKPATIPGAEVLTRIADTTIRRPDTIKEDIATHLADVSGNRAHLVADVAEGKPGAKTALKAHDAYVKQLADAAENKAFLKNPGPAFKASEAYAKDYPPVQAQAHALGHYGTMTAEQLQARELAHFAVTHMRATMDETGRLVDPAGKPLSNEAIIAEINHPTRGTGGRMPTFTSDRVRFDREQAARSARYVSSDRVPLPNTKKNTLYAFTHGLTSPGHEALTEQHVMMQGIVDSLHAERNRLETLKVTKPDGGTWATYGEAKRAGQDHGLVPINISQPFHPQGSLDQMTEGLAPATVEEEAVRRSLDFSQRMQPGGKGRWALIDPQAAKALKAFSDQVSPNATLRTIRGLNNQFRTVALATSPKHVPGVAQENLIRDIGNGVGFRSWITGRRIARGLKETPEGQRVLTGLTGGQAAGMTEAGKTYFVSDHWQGTNAYPFLKSFEAAAKTPGVRQIRTTWRAWTKFALGTTKHLLEQQHQIAGLGKAALREHGYAEAARTAGFMGLAKRAFALHGQMLEDATRGLYDPAKARQMRKQIDQMYGKWTDLSPGAQTALMFSPFGLWWVNSVKFLARAPVDMPVKTSLLASYTLGTQKQREAQGLDMFGANPLPLYEQGGIPAGGKILAQNYYSPFGIANDPIATGQSLIQPWLTPVVTGALGVNWLGKPLSAPGMNTSKANERDPSIGQRAQYILDSAAASFLPFYTKAQQVASGGASQYDVTSNRGQFLPSIPSTKTPGKGALAGLEKASQPFRTYKKVASKGSAGNYVLGSSPSGGSSSGGYLLGGQSGASSGYLLGP